ncbi:VOC family protein [Sphaerisporangium sp. NPDC051017]|uniref:VOC family protein n=1 Tax=unclassified Sphaerisporangium TaxID=2630420 RepID=UPI0033CD76D6
MPQQPARTTPPVVNVSKVGYVGFRTPDLDRLVEHYTKTLDFVLVERDTRRAFLTTSFDHHCVVLEQAPEKQSRSFVGFQVAEDLDAAARRLREAGYPVERRTDIAPATPTVLVVEEPLTGTPIHLYDAQSGSGVDGQETLRPTKLGHVAAFTPELGPLQDFYQDLLGFRWSDTVGDFFVFLRCNSDHHAANFMASKKFTGMHHVAFETRDLNHLQTLLDHLATRSTRLEWGPGRHGPGHNIFTYHRDPDGNNIELFTQLDTISNEANGYFEPRPWHEDHPQYPKTWEVDLATINSWGPIHDGQIDH